MMEDQNSVFIKAINKEAVHRICSGQVVLNLAVAVKELVENSLDAGATVVEIRLREYGSELVEVTDNGSGVEPMNFQALTLKHHTSKLQDFSDLVSVETFGFRGEALSSLCSLSNLTVTTRHVSSNCGSRLAFDHNGLITSSTSVARQVGTTVTLENIFSTLPVRQKEFHRNLKREFTKMTQLLYAYCLVSTGVKITCTNQTKKGGRMTVACTQGCKTVRENVASLFGTKQLASLLEMQKVAPSPELLEQLNLKDLVVEEVLSNFSLEGLVSSCAHGSGRSTSDRQFYYVNSRPCEPTKVMKAVNEVYRQYNMHQQPFVFLNIISARDSVDVNVTPDKRQVFMEHEKLLVATLKASLQALYENIPSTYTVNNVQTSSMTSLPSISKTSASPAAVLSQWSHSSAKRTMSAPLSGHQPKQPKLDTIFRKKEKTTEFLNRFAKFNIPKDKDDINEFESEETTQQNSVKENHIHDSQHFYNCNETIDTIKCNTIKTSGEFDVDFEKNQNNSKLLRTDLKIYPKVDCNGIHDEEMPSVEKSSNCSDIFGDKSSVWNKLRSTINENSEATLSRFEKNQNKFEITSTHFKFKPKDDCNGVEADDIPSDFNSNGHDKTPKMSEESSSEIPPNISESTSSQPEICDSSETRTYLNNQKKESEPSSLTWDLESDLSISLSPFSSCNSNTDLEERSPDVLQCQQASVEYDTVDDINGRERRRVEVSTSISDLRELVRKSQERKNIKEESIVKFRAVIDPSKNKQAEQELSREISKDMFSKMEVIGQFNLGFVIAKLNSDLFIVDQHATDEKYNFETLQRTTSISNQKLVVPQQLELTAVNEIILLDNINVFKANGFEFAIDENAPPTTKVKLTSIPMSRNWTFGKEDIDELLFMLQDAPNTLCRPSRVRAMFASRACRKSVMIGTALSWAEMQRLLTHMGEIEQPWNCPHGRPTMRHLVNLEYI